MIISKENTKKKNHQNCQPTNTTFRNYNSYEEINSDFFN